MRWRERMTEWVDSPLGVRGEHRRSSSKQVAGGSFQDKYNFHATSDIIRTAEKGELPDQIMFTFHPQR